MVNIIGVVVDVMGMWIIVVVDYVEFGGQENLVLVFGDCFVDQFFVGVWIIYVGGIDQGDVLFQCGMQGGDGFLVVVVFVKIIYVYVV